jgi:hypothetical protein
MMNEAVMADIYACVRVWCAPPVFTKEPRKGLLVARGTQLHDREG